MRPSNRQRGSHASTRVAILTPMISRENGGAASLLDLAQGFSSLGADVSLIATSDSPTRFMVSRNRSGILKGYDRRGLHRIRLRRIDGPPRVGGIRALQGHASPKRLAMWLGDQAEATLLSPRARRALVRSDLIIDGTAGKAVGEFELLDIGRSKLALNHNFSGDALYKMSPGGTRDLPEAHRALVAKYGWLLFQSSDVANEVRLLDAEPTSRYLVVQPSCSEGEILASKRMPSPYKHHFSVVVVGSIQRRKGQRDAIEALAGCPDHVILHLVGPIIDSTYYHELLAEAARLEVVDRVVVHGYRKDYARFLAHADILLQPSSAEGVSRVLREAMCCGLPIVAYRIPGTSATLTDGVDSRLVEPTDVHALTDALCGLIEDPAYTREMGHSARLTYERTYSWSQLLARLNGLLESVARVS